MDAITIGGEFHGHDLDLLDYFINGLYKTLERLTGVSQCELLPPDSILCIPKAYYDSVN